MHAGTASSQQFSAVLRTKIESRRARKFEAGFAATEHFLLHDAETEQFSEVLAALAGVQTCAASDARVVQWLSTMSRKRPVFQSF